MKHLPKLREALRQLTGQATPGESLHQTLQLIESELSFDAVRQALRNAIQIERAEGEPYRYRWIQDVYPTFFVYSDNSGDATTLYKATYSIDASGAATIGTPVPVRAETTYVEVVDSTDILESGNAQAGCTTRLAETVISLNVRESRAIREDGTMLIKIASPGKGSSGRYSRAVLESDIPKVFPAGTHMYADHPTASEEVERPERSVKDLAAVTIDTPVWMEESDAPEGEGMYVNTKPFASYATDLDDKALAIGVSINAAGTATIGSDGIPDITSLTEGYSIDFVTKAGRGGQIVSLKESARAKAHPSPTPSPSQENNDVNEQEAAQLRESARQSNERAETAERQLVEASLAPTIRTFVETELAAIEMPTAMRAKLTESLIKTPRLKEGVTFEATNPAASLDQDAFRTAINEAATQELSYAQAAFGYGDGTVKGAGSGAPTNDDTGAVKMNESLRVARAGMGLS